MRFINTVFVFLLFAVLSACEKVPDEVIQSQEDARTAARITGRVILPTGAGTSSNVVTVSSSWDSTAVANATYSLEVIGGFSTLFAKDRAGNVVLMSYNYPGQQDYNITSRSSAIALLMTSPAMQSLTGEGRIDAVRRLTTDADFPNLVNAIEVVIRAGKPLLDPSNSQLLNVLGKLFETASLQGRGVVRPKPIVIKRSGKVVSLLNNRVVHGYVAGLYKDGVKVGNPVTIKGSPMFAASVYDALKGLFFNGYSEPDQQLFTLQGDGNFSIRIRSGLRDPNRVLGQIDRSPEFLAARQLNGEDYVIGILLEHIPIPSTCLTEVRKALYGVQTNIGILDDAANASSLDEFNVSMLTYLANALSSAEDLMTSCIKPEKVSIIDSFAKDLGKYLKFLTLDSKVATLCNIAAHSFDWFNSTAAIDTCFSVTGNAVSDCNCLPQTLPLLEVMTGGGSQTWRMTGLTSGSLPVRTVHTIIGTPPTLTFRTDNTLVRTRYSSIERIGSNPPTIQFFANSLLTEYYCLSRSGNKIMYSSSESPSGIGNIMTISSPNANTLVLSEFNNNGGSYGSAGLSDEELTYTKQ